MRLVDLTHPWNLHTPGWVGYPGARIYYTQTLQTNRIVSQRIETSLHTGTHLDGPMHGTDGGLDIASLPLEKLVHQGVVVDVSSLKFLASLGIRALLKTAKAVDERGGRMVLVVGANSQVAMSLEATGVSDLLPMFKSSGEAERAAVA